MKIEEYKEIEEGEQDEEDEKLEVGDENLWRDGRLTSRPTHNTHGSPL